jgi:hypothetical protein
MIGIIPFAQAQEVDKIYLKDQTLIECKIVEIGTSEIKYYPLGEENGPIYTLETIRIEKLILASGKEMTFDELNQGAVNYQPLDQQKKNAFKVNMLSILNTNLSFSYERSIRPGRSFETELGFIGVGTDINERDPKGMHASFGYKFFRSPDWYIQGMKYGHVLNGLYIKPEISLSLYEHNTYWYDPWTTPPYEVRETVFAYAVIATLGRQWVFDDAFLFDVYAGLGFGNNGQNDADYPSNYGFSGGFDELPLAWKAGIRIGFLTK